jgi:hypothetical protein
MPGSKPGTLVYESQIQEPLYPEGAELWALHRRSGPPSGDHEIHNGGIIRCTAAAKLMLVSMTASYVAPSSTRRNGRAAKHPNIMHNGLLGLFLFMPLNICVKVDDERFRRPTLQTYSEI